MDLRRVIIVGLVASVVMGMIEMLYEAVAGAGLWSPVVFIAATVLRDLQGTHPPVAFQLVPVVLGLMGHMMNSVILGLVFSALIAPRLRGVGALVVGGVVYSLVVFLVMWLVLLPLIDPVMLQLNSPFFAVAHMMWGAVLGLGLGWRSSETPTRQPAH
ncbi:MAG: hypothetical protein HYY04_04735 [Chloroflexi bacterium]|nr:hypothetical protein [Chloroflexota bacterium]